MVMLRVALSEIVHLLPPIYPYFLVLTFPPDITFPFSYQYKTILHGEGDVTFSFLSSAVKHSSPHSLMVYQTGVSQYPLHIESADATDGQLAMGEPQATHFIFFLRISHALSHT